MEQKSTLKSVSPDIISFLIGLSIAYFMQWEVRDMVWSLWLASICIGYLTLLIAISTIAYGWFNQANQGNSKTVPNSTSITKSARPPLLVFLLGSLFFIAFFSVHFGGFHLIHAIFLNSFFPLAGLEVDLAHYLFNEPSRLFSIFFFSIFLPYALFLIPAILAERNHIFQPIKVLKEKLKALKQTNNNQDQQANSTKINIAAVFGRPYRNVVRMHLLIFFFAFSYFLKIDSFIIFVIVYAVYFFPWNVFKKQIKVIPQKLDLENK